MSRDKSDPLSSPSSPKSWRKKAAILLGVVVVGVGAFYAYQAFTPQTTTYLTMPVTTGKITDMVQATGTVKPLQEADLKFKNDGVLQSLTAKIGIAVVQGQELAVQDDADLRTAVDQAANEVTQAQFRLRQAELDLNKVRTATSRQQALYKQGAIAEADLEQAQLDYENAVINRDMAKASITSAQVKLQIAQNTLKDAVLSAPFNGIISSVDGEVGQDSSIVLIHMISPQLQVIAQVNEADISRVKVDQAAYLTLASGTEQRITGVVKQISPQATTVNNIQLYQVAITVDDKKGLLMPGMSTTANIIANESSSDMTLVQNMAFTFAQTFKPSSASASAGGKQNASSGVRANAQGGTIQGAPTSASPANSSRGNAASQTSSKRVVVLENGQPVIKVVQTGLSDGQNTEIISGLEPGDKVVIGTSDGSGSTDTATTGGQNRSNSGGTRVRSGPGPMF